MLSLPKFTLPPRAPPARPKPKRFWEIFFTIENPVTDVINFNTELVRYAIWQKEMGENGIPRLRGYVEFKNNITEKKASEFIGPNAKFEKAFVYRDRARDHCRKEENRIDGPWEYGIWYANYHSNYWLIIQLVEDGLTEEEIKRDHLKAYRHYKSDCIRLIKRRDEARKPSSESESDFDIDTDIESESDSELEDESEVELLINMLQVGMTEKQIKRFKPELHQKYKKKIYRWFNWNKVKNSVMNKKPKESLSIQKNAPLELNKPLTQTLGDQSKFSEFLEQRSIEGLLNMLKKYPINTSPSGGHEYIHCVPASPSGSFPKRQKFMSFTWIESLGARKIKYTETTWLGDLDMPSVDPILRFAPGKGKNECSDDSSSDETPEQSAEKTKSDAFFALTTIEELLNLVNKYPINTSPDGCILKMRCSPDPIMSAYRGYYPKKHKSVSFSWKEAVGSRKIEYSETSWLGGRIIPTVESPIIQKKRRNDSSDEYSR